MNSINLWTTLCVACVLCLDCSRQQSTKTENERQIANSESATQENKLSDTKQQETTWDREESKKLAAKFNSPEAWDMKTLKMEVANLEKNPPADLPLFSSPFPTPKYSSPGNGNGPIETKIGDTQIVGQFVIIGKDEFSKHLFKNPTDQFVNYFTILTIPDGQDAPNPVSASSRNHPHYLSQGSLNTSTKSRVDWVAVQLADENAYAIVNSRIFDLRVGRIILAAPQTDGSIRFHQLDAPVMNSKEQETYIENLKADKEVVAFFSAKTNIPTR